MKPPGHLVPSFFIAGAPKSGTTSLYTYLRSHPGIFLPDIKEPHYFSTDFPGLRVVEDSEMYGELFLDAPAGALMGDASASYLMSEEAVPNILSLRPDAQFVIILRNPIEMAHAFHSEMVVNLNESETDFSKAWHLQEARAEGRKVPRLCVEPRLLQYQSICSLGTQLERLFTLTLSDRRLLLLFDDFRLTPDRTYSRVLSFLGVGHDGREEFPRENPGRVHRSRLLAVLHRTLTRKQGVPHAVLKRMANSMGIQPSKILSRRNQVIRERPSLRPAFLSQLKEEFEPEIGKVARLLDRDLSHWLPDPVAGGERI